MEVAVDGSHSCRRGRLEPGPERAAERLDALRTGGEKPGQRQRGVGEARELRGQVPFARQGDWEVVKLVERVAGPAAEGEEAVGLAAIGKSETVHRGEELDTERRHRAEGGGEAEEEFIAHGTEPPEGLPCPLEPGLLRHLPEQGLREPAGPGDVVAEHALAPRLVAHRLDVDRAHPPARMAGPQYGIQDRRHGETVRGRGKRCQARVCGEDEEEEAERWRIGGGLRAPRHRGPASLVDPLLQLRPLLGSHPLGRDERHPSARRRLVQHPKRPSVVHGHAVHREPLGRAPGIAQPAEEGSYTLDV